MITKEQTTIPNEVIMSKIVVIREKKVMLDTDLADLYQTDTKLLKRQVRRNIERFPEDFMFELTPEEINNLRCQFGTSSWGGTRYSPMAFTEQGVSMLSSVLNSPVAIQVNIQIIRIFHKMRDLLLTHKDLIGKMEELEQKVDGQDEKIQIVFEYLKQFIREQTTERSTIGFQQAAAKEQVSDVNQ